MARVTVEDCIENVDSRFELIMLASHRARDLAAGAMPTIDRDKDKNPVVALREIAEETISIDDLREQTVKSFQRIQPIEEQEEDLDSILAADSAQNDTNNQSTQITDNSQDTEDQLIGGNETLIGSDDGEADDSQLIG